MKTSRARAAALLLLLCTVPCATSERVIAAMLPQTGPGSSCGAGIRLEMAVRLAAAQHPSVTESEPVTVDVFDTKSDPTEAVRLAYQAISDYEKNDELEFLGFVGAGSTPATRGVAQVAKGAGKPIASFVANSFGSKVDMLQDLDLVHVAPTDDNATGKALAELIWQVGWKEIASITQAELYNVHVGMDAVRHEAGFEVTSEAMLPDDFTLPLLDHQKEYLLDVLWAISRPHNEAHSSHTRVVVLLAHPAVAAAVLHTAHSIGMVGEGWTWVGVHWQQPRTWEGHSSDVLEDDATFLSQVAEAAEGSVGIVSVTTEESASELASGTCRLVQGEDVGTREDAGGAGRRPAWVDGVFAKCGGDAASAAADVEAWCAAWLSTESFSAEYEAALAYDGVYTLLSTEERREENARGEGGDGDTTEQEFRNALVDVRFDGMSGAVSYHSDGTRSSTTLSAVNVQTERRIVRIGAAHQLDLSAVRWPGDSTVTPPDRAPTEAGAASWYIFFVCLCLMVCLMIANAMETHKIRRFPEMAMVVSLGLLVGLFYSFFASEEFIEAVKFDEHLFNQILLPIIIFESGFTLHPKLLFFKNIGSILLFAVIGTIILTLTTGSILFGMSSSGTFGEAGPSLSLSESMAFAALISAIDPVSALAIFGALRIEPLLNMMVFGESVINDAVAIALFRTFAEGLWGNFTLLTVMAALLKFVTIFLLSTIVGIITALLGALVIKHNHFHHREFIVAVIFLISYAANTGAEAMHQSGIVSSLACGIVLNYYGGKNLDEPTKKYAKSFFYLAAHVSEVLIFFQVGENVFIFDDGTDKFPWAFSIITMLICSLLRGVMVVIFSAFLNMCRSRNRIQAKHQVVMWHAGLRGAIAFALAIVFPSQHRNAIVSCTMFIILFTIFVQGCSLYDVLRLLGIELNISTLDNRYDQMSDATDTPGSPRRRNGGEEGWFRALANFNANYLMPIFGSGPSGAEARVVVHAPAPGEAKDEGLGMPPVAEGREEIGELHDVSLDFTPDVDNSGHAAGGVGDDGQSTPKELFSTERAPQWVKNAAGK